MNLALNPTHFRHLGKPFFRRNTSVYHAGCRRWGTSRGTLISSSGRRRIKRLRPCNRERELPTRCRVPITSPRITLARQAVELHAGEFGRFSGATGQFLGSGGEFFPQPLDQYEVLQIIRCLGMRSVILLARIENRTRRIRRLRRCDELTPAAVSGVASRQFLAAGLDL